MHIMAWAGSGLEGVDYKETWDAFLVQAEKMRGFKVNSEPN